MLCKITSAARSSRIPAPLRLKPLAFAMRMVFAGLLTAGFINPVHAQTAPKEKQEATEKEKQEATASDVTTLPEMKISAERADELPQPYAGGQVARGGRLGVLGNMDLMKAPFSISSYTSQMMQNQHAITAADLLTRDPSVRSTGQRGGVVDSFYIRGFPIGEGNVGEFAFDGQYGVAPNYRIFTEYAERIEVLKGPAALLYGISPNSGVGGVINIVPKRASPTDLTRLTGNYLSGAQGGGHLDVSRRFGPDRQFGIRLNGSHHQGDTLLDNQFRQADIASVALDYQGERFRATLDAFGQYERFKAPSRPFLVAADIAVPPAPNGRRNVTQPWGWSKIKDAGLLLKAEYDLSDALTLFASVGGAHTWVDRLSDQTPRILNAAGDTSSVPMFFRFGIDRSSADGGLRARFNTGPIRHNVTLQGTGYRDRLERGSTAGTAVLSNMYSPIDRPGQALATPGLMKVSETEFYGGALTDTVSMAEERILLTLGVRFQQVRSDNFSSTGAVTSTYDKGAITPLVGLVVRPWKNVSIYANRMEGLSKGDIAPQIAVNAGQALAPYKTEQLEVGVKVDYGRLITTLSLFQIKRPSPLLMDNVFSLTGEQRNQGVELAMFGEPVSGIRLLGGVTLVDGELTKTDNPATRGNRAVGVPVLQANMGAEWDMPWLPGFTLTGNLVHTGKRYINQTNTQSAPSWTTFDFGARYSTKVAGKPTIIRANLLNAFDRNYWAGVASFGTLSLGTPRTVLVSATVDF